RYANVNATVIGRYAHPKVRLPGAGGSDEIAAWAHRTYLLTPHQKRRLPERVAFITGAGYLTGHTARTAAKQRGAGPQAGVTDLDLHVRNDGKTEYCQRIEVVTRAGQPATSYTDDCPSRRDRTQIGRRLTVYYDPSVPSDTRSKGWVGVEGSGLIGGAVG